MKKILSYLVVFSAVATPALAFEVEEIGTIVANFGGEVISQSTARITDGKEDRSTASLQLLGPMSSLSISGFEVDGAILVIDVTFLSELPGTEAPIVDVEITYWPTGDIPHWTAYEAPGLDNIDFTTLTLEGDNGHVTGTFSATLCHVESYEEDADMNNCRPIDGSFDTLVEIQR